MITTGVCMSLTVEIFHNGVWKRTEKKRLSEIYEFTRDHAISFDGRNIEGLATTWSVFGMDDILVQRIDKILDTKMIGADVIEFPIVESKTTTNVIKEFEKFLGLGGKNE